MSKVSLQRIDTFQNDVSAPAVFNANMALLEAIIDTLLSRDGTAPNQVTADLDLNGYRILNLPNGSTNSEPVTQQQLSELVLSATAGSITNGSVTEPAFANGAVSTRALADSSVTAAKIADGTIAAAELASNAVTTAKITDANVTLAKLAAIANQTVLGNNSGSSGSPQEISFTTLGSLLFSSAATVPTGALSAFAGSRVASGYLLCDGSTVSRTTYSALYAFMCPSATVTFTVASGLVNWASHPIANWDKVVFSTTGTLPSGITAGTTYYARDVVAGVSFKLAATAGGAALALSGSPTGTHTAQAVGFGLGDGSTTFTLPDFRGEFLRGHDLGRGVDANRSLGDAQSHQLQDHVHTTGSANATTLNGTLAVTVKAASTPGDNTSVPTTGNHGTETRPRNLSVAIGVKT